MMLRHAIAPSSVVNRARSNRSDLSVRDQRDSVLPDDNSVPEFATESWYKSSDILVLRPVTGQGVYLIHRGTKELVVLGEQSEIIWNTWPAATGYDPSVKATIDELANAGMIFKAPPVSPPAPHPLDEVVPRIAPRKINWHPESSGLSVLFNTETMQVFVLGTYGSFCWNAIVAGQTIRQIRLEGLRIFARDDVLALLSRLAEFNFIEAVEGLDGEYVAPDRLFRDLYVPGIQRWIPHSDVPWSCDWELNTVCNLRCRHCYLPNHTEAGPVLADANLICQEIIDAGIPLVTLLGGEVLLRNDLEEIVSKLRSADIFVSVVSNGLLLTPQRAASLAAAGLSRMMLSLDGLTDQVHDACRGPNTFAKTLGAIRNAQEAGLNVVSIWTVHSENIFQLDGLPDFADKIGVSAFCIDLFKKTGELGAEASYQPLGRDVVAKIQERIALWRQTQPHFSVIFEPGCTCGRTRVTIGADGYARMCTFLDKDHGLIGQKSLTEIWASMTDGYSKVGPLGYCCGKNETSCSPN